MITCQAPLKGRISGGRKAHDIGFSASTVQDTDPGVEVAREQDPQQIGDLQTRRRGIDLTEGGNHGEYEEPQRAQPQERETVGPEIEKYDAPEEIEGQLQKVQEQTPGTRSGRGSQIYPRRANAHEEIENGPYDREHDTGRRKGRLYDRLVEILDALPREQAGQPADKFREQDP